MYTTSITHDAIVEIAYGDKERAFGIWNSECLPVGMTCVGVAKFDDGGSCALMKSSAGFYYAGAQGALRALPKDEVIRAL